MRRSDPGDALRLDPDVVAWHQLQSFVAEPRRFADGLSTSPLFRDALRRGRGSAEWIRYDDEDDVLPFPLGRVTVHAGGVLLEAFSEERVHALQHCVQGLAAGRLAADEIRVFRLETALLNPDALLQPLRGRRGGALDERDVAIMWLRMAWPFIPREDLGDRVPVTLLATGRGRMALEALLPGLPRELEAISDFPPMTPEELRRVLLPAAPTNASSPGPKRVGAPRS